MAFKAPISLVKVEGEEVKYKSGYSDDEEHKIKERKTLIDNRDLKEYPVTLQEFRETIVPWFRVNRTKEFILHPEKIKPERKPREPKAPKVPKIKKLTKAQAENKLKGLVVKLVTQGEFTQEEKDFYFEQTGQQL